MANQQTVIVDFEVDYSNLTSAVDTLVELGAVDKALADTFKKTNTEVVRQGNAIDAVSKKAITTTRTFSSLNELMKQYPRSGMHRFLLQIGNDLADAGFDADKFFKKMKDGPKEVEPKLKSLKGELREIKEQMVAAALSGGKLGDEYKRLKQRAGELDDTIRDVASDIKNTGSDTRHIDNVVGSISALAGGYSAVQGAAALFGNESEDLQKALLKVNGAMALATGIQQVSNALQKEGSLARLADATATGVQIAVQRIYTFVTGQATAATLAFKIALASTGIGLVVVGVIALAHAFSGASDKAKTLTKDLEKLAEANAGAVRSLNRARDEAVALAEQQGKTGSEVSKVNIEFLNKEIKKNRELEDQQRKTIADASTGNKVKKEAADALNKTFESGLQLRSELVVAERNLQKQIADERKEAAEKQKELNEKALAESRKLRLSEFEDFKAGVEIKLLAAEKGSREELDLRKKLARAQLQIDLEGENLTANQRKLLIQQFFADKIELEKKFSKEVLEQSLSDEKLRLAAQLENLNLSEEDKLAVKISFLQISAAQEIEAAEKNAAKIKSINAKLNADITAAKIESIKKQADYEIAFSAATGGGAKRALDAVAANEKLKGDIRINAIRQLGEREQQVLDRQIKANRDAAAVIGSDQKALALEYEQLLDQKAAAAEATEKKITDLTLSEQTKRRDNDIAYIQATVAGLQQIADIVATLQASEQERIQGIIDARRKEVEGLLEAGAITEKEALARNKRLNEEERKAKIKAAQQQKNLAVFQAFLAIPQAYIAGLTAPPPLGGPIYAAILAGLAAVQAAVIAARPLPKFASGKKGSYSGPGIVGEAGAELIQRKDGSMEVATRRSLVYLGSQDKVFTAGETKKMLPYVNREAMGMKDGVERFDYNKLAKAVGNKGNGTTVNIDKEFISESVADGLSRVNYFDRYYNSKG